MKERQSKMMEEQEPRAHLFVLFRDRHNTNSFKKIKLKFFFRNKISYLFHKILKGILENVLFLGLLLESKLV